ncbi:hypothetical protein QC761_0050480 [Podospora bellae-mahoneyi]|uniref:Uncharacterized protein n=1 Tax=Podospora bellae-mahoneyi TaxID=2093777 RepID=A0ABR0FJS6_9PEZI|nr:hypothetical protein QC761_0050480 [Podospora bellae-mahoneyi]
MPRHRHGMAFSLPEPVEVPVLHAVLVVLPRQSASSKSQKEYIIAQGQAGHWMLDVLLAHFLDIPPMDAKTWYLYIHRFIGN